MNEDKDYDKKQEEIQTKVENNNLGEEAKQDAIMRRSHKFWLIKILMGVMVLFSLTFVFAVLVSLNILSMVGISANLNTHSTILVALLATIPTLIGVKILNALTPENSQTITNFTTPSVEVLKEHLKSLYEFIGGFFK